MEPTTAAAPMPFEPRARSVKPVYSRFKFGLWTILGVIALFVFITSEVFLIADYPMYHGYRLQVIADRQLLIPHTICGLLALLAAGQVCQERPCRPPLGSSAPRQPS